MQEKSPRKRRLGRPRSEAKRQDILNAARRVFLKSGYGATSMDVVASEAGVSKQTVYGHFGSKDALFEAIIREVSGSVVSPLLTPETRTLDPKETLSVFAAHFMDIVLSPTVTALYRVVIPEVRRFPELGEIFYHSGPGRAVKTLAAYLRDQSEQGTLEVADANLAAQQFLGMLAGIPNIRRLLDIGEEPSKRERKRIVREAVRSFLKAHARQRKPKSG